MQAHTSIIEHRLDREEIDDWLKRSVPIRRISVHFQISATTLTRYRDLVWIPRLAKAVAQRDGVQFIRDTQMVALIKDIMEQHYEMAKAQRQSGDLSDAGAQLSRIIRGIDVWVKLAAEYREQMESSLAQTDAWAKVREVITLALAPYPKAQKVVVQALERIGL